MTRLRISRDARDDIRDIGRYSKASFGVPLARVYLQGLSNAFERIRERPLLGVARDDLGTGVRAFGYRSHRIYYDVTASSVDILRILHQAPDVHAAFAASE